MLSGRAAAQRPEGDALHPTTANLVAHRLVKVGKGASAWVSRQSSTAPWAPGSVDPVSGVYSAVANRVTEAQRRTAGMRRNGQPRRRVTRGA